MSMKQFNKIVDEKRLIIESSNLKFQADSVMLKNKKPSKQAVSRVLMWAQMDLNHRPSDYESDALTN